MKSPAKASAQRSIWSFVGLQTFYNSLDQLQKLFAVPTEIIHPPREDSKNTVRRTLPFEQEVQLADDFAFLAAYDHGAEYVTTATVELQEDLSGLVVVLAANEGVSDSVLNAFNAILTVLESCARKSMFDL